MAAENNRVEIIEMLIERKATDWDNAMIAAARGGHITLVVFFSRYAKNVDRAMIKIVLVMIEKGANNWNKAMIAAVKGGHDSRSQRWP